MAFENIEIHRFDERIGLGITEEEELEDLRLPGGQKKDKYLDGPDVQKNLKRLLNWWYRERQLQAQPRTEQMTDHKFYDGKQWDEDDEQYLKDRGQKALVFNQVKPAVDWVVGTEKRTRIDYKILPRKKEQGPTAETKTKGMKYLSDVNKETFQRSRSFEDMIKCGIGWLEYGVRNDTSDERIFSRFEDWRNIWYDSLANELDMSDARYLFRSKFVDLDIGCAMFPERADIIKAASINDHSYHDEEMTGLDITPVEGEEGYLLDQWHGIETPYFRSRVRLVEGWYRLPMRAKIMKGPELGSLNGVRFDKANEDHNYLVNNNYASLYDAIRMQVYCMLFCSTGALANQESPYNHNRFPFIPIVCYRKKTDNTPYGLIRQLRDPQEDLNKRRSKALFILQTNQTVADDDATEDWDDFKEELDRPDGLIRKKPGSDVSINKETKLVEEHVMLMGQDAEYIERTAGVNDEMMGRQTNAVSGKAISQRYEMGTVVTASPFDNLRYAFQLAGEMKLSLIEQFWTEEKEIRITGKKGQPEFISLNSVDPDTGEKLNDITQTQGDFAVDEQAHSATVRQAMFDAMMELTTKIPPEVTIKILDLIVDLSDIPSKDAFVERIRKLNGEKDPFRDPDDPEVIAEEEAEAVAAQRAADVQKFLEELMVENERWKAAKLKAETIAIEDKTAPEVDKLEAEADAIDAKARRDDEIAEDDSVDKEVKNELQRAKQLAEIEKADKDRESNRQQMQLQQKEDKNGRTNKKGNAISKRTKTNARKPKKKA
jgi:hypothetical protein